MYISNIRFYIDPETDLPHIYNHNVDEDEVEEVLANSRENRKGYDGARIAIGQTRAGRYLRVIYVPDPKPGSIFVITAYEPNFGAKRWLATVGEGGENDCKASREDNESFSRGLE